MLMKTLLLLVCIAVMLLHIMRRGERWDLIMTFLLLGYVALIAWFTVVGRVPLASPRAMNLVPGGSVRTMYLSPWNNRGRYEFVEILGNLALFFPLGVCLRHYGKRSYPIILVAAIVVSAGIEFAQYTMNIGTFEMDDILHNVWGAELGANCVSVLDHWKQGDRRITFRDMFAFWPLLMLCLYALAMYIRFVMNKGWLY